MKKAIIKVEEIKESDRICRCCNNQATTYIELGQDFSKFIQTSSIYLCNEHKRELNDKLNQVK